MDRLDQQWKAVSSSRAVVRSTRRVITTLVLMPQYRNMSWPTTIYYYSHAGPDVLDADLFGEVAVADFVETLKARRERVEVELKAKPREEPFVLCHGDLQGRNILMRGTDIVAVIDWEIAGSLPLSELEDTGVEVLEMVDEVSEEECMKWSEKIS